MISNDNLILMALAAIVIYFMFIQKEHYNPGMYQKTYGEEQRRKEQQKKREQQQETERQAKLNAIRGFFGTAIKY